MSFPLGLPALQGTIAAPGKGRITVAVGQNGATLLVSAGGGISAFRTCEATNASEVGGKPCRTAMRCPRELRVTFEQVPADLRARSAGALAERRSGFGQPAGGQSSGLAEDRRG